MPCALQFTENKSTYMYMCTCIYNVHVTFACTHVQIMCLLISFPPLCSQHLRWLESISHAYSICDTAHRAPNTHKVPTHNANNKCLYYSGYAFFDLTIYVHVHTAHLCSCQCTHTVVMTALRAVVLFTCTCSTESSFLGA